MSKNRTVSLILALALCAATFAPRTSALGGRRDDARPSAASHTQAPDAFESEPSESEAAEPTDDDAQKSKRKGNGFARALGAPFRALARLFGGKKSSGEEAKRRKANPTQTAAVKSEPNANAEAPKQPAPPAPEVNNSKPEVKTEARDSKKEAREPKKGARDSVAYAPKAAALKVDKTRVKTNASRAVAVNNSTAVASAPRVESPEPAPELQSVVPEAVAPVERAAALRVDKNRLKTNAARAVALTNGPEAGARGPLVESSEVAPELNVPKPAAPSEVSTRPAEVATRPARVEARPGEGARVVRPDESGAVVEPPKMWVPVIEGISKDPLTQGRALLEHGYVHEAVSELSVAAVQVGPNLVEANNLLGIAYDRIGLHKEAFEAYNRALTAAPNDANVIANLGYSLYLADDYAGALKRLKQAAKLSPGQPVIYNNLGIVLARTRKYEEAYKYFAIATNEYDAHLKLASVLEDQGRDSDAIKHYEAALAMQPGASAVLERLVALYERTGERDKADTARRALGRPKNEQKTTTGGGGGGD